MFEQFSRGYYLGRLYVEPRDADRAAMARAQHAAVNEQLYADEAGATRPLVMKLGRTHLAVHGDDGVPADTLAVPESLLDETAVRNPPTLKEVLLATADRAAQLLALAGEVPDDGQGAPPWDGDGPAPT
jgi:hypothetical protein